MGQRAEQMIRVALDAFADRDADKARSLSDLDNLIDRANVNASNEILSLGDSPAEREYGLRMLVVSRCVERIGDHAVDIGEQVFFLVTGEIREFTDASHPMRIACLSRRGSRWCRRGLRRSSRRRTASASASRRSASGT